MSNNSIKSFKSIGGVGFSGLLTIVFIVLKLCGIIKWSWLWVLAPLWINAAFVILLLIIYVILSVIENKN